MKVLLDQLILLNPENVNKTIEHMIGYICNSYINKIAEEYNIKIIKINFEFEYVFVEYENIFYVLGNKKYYKNEEWIDYNCLQFQEIHEKIFKLDKYYLKIYNNNL